MSRPNKRNAEVAFEGADNSNPHSSKRHRKSKKRQQNKPTKELQNGLVTLEASKQQDASGKTVLDVLAKSPQHQTVEETSQLMKKKKKKRSRQEAATITSETKDTGPVMVMQSKISEDHQKYKTKKEKKKQKGEKAKGRDRMEVANGPAPTTGNPWLMKKAIGGAFIDHDPLLVQSGQYLILPTESEVQIYSTSTSLLVRSLVIGEYQSITSCVITESNPSSLLVATRRGNISLWDWTSGQLICQWKIRDNLRQIISLLLSEGIETILALHEDKGQSTLSSYQLSVIDKSANEITCYLKRDGLNSNVQFMKSSGLLLVSAYKKLIVGYCPGFDASQLQGTTFTWREISVSSLITSLDSQIRNDDSRSNKVPTIDIVLGLKSGMILVYEDILGKLVSNDKGGPTNDLIPRQLHWHRNTVNTLKWSRDGNYIVSGGTETVLVIWQLDTNQKQTLPHLSTSILNLTISEAGSEYAILLGDNSVMVLSTADLLPSTNVCGPCISQRLDSTLPCLAHPISPERLLVAVQSNVIDARNRKGRQRTALQTFDFVSNMQISRQALTRNLITARNTAPEGQILQEPNITGLQISYDGKWLATIEQWYPSSEDVSGMYLADEVTTRNRMVDTCLRFWIYNEQQASWEMNTRIDSPHSKTGVLMLDLKSHPRRTEFATIGSDRTVRTWSPKARLRDGVPIRNQSGIQLYTWTSSQTIHCDEVSTDSALDNVSTASLAYAEDGSILAASWSVLKGKQRYTHLIDCQSGKTCLSIPDLVSSGPVSLATSGRLLLALSKNFCIFDMISCEPILDIKLDSIYQDTQTGRYLVVNKHDGTFAIGVNSSDTNKRGKLIVFNIETLEAGPVFERSIPNGIVALLSYPTASGYVVVDGSARIRQVRGPGASSSMIISARAESEEVAKGLDSIFGSRATITSSTQSETKLLTEGGNESTTNTLEDVLGFQRSAEAPPVGELFDRIAGIFAASAVRA